MTDPKAADIFKSILQVGKIPDSAGPAPSLKDADQNKANESSALSGDADNQGGILTAAAIPTQQGPEGIRYDFNIGLRVQVPEGKWRVRFFDLDTETVFFDGEGSKCTFGSRKKHYLRAKIEVFRDGVLIFSHIYDATDRPVAILMPGGTIGDSIAWFTYAARFKKQHGCKLVVVLADQMKELLEPAYPDITFILRKDYLLKNNEYYATYHLGLFFEDEDNSWQPADFRMVGLHRTAGYILGVSPEEERPQLVISGQRPIEEPYVVIATQASSQCKYWNNPEGWHDVIEFLKRSGYRVVCIDKDMVWGQGLHWNQIPNGCEDQTGARPLSERANWLKHAEFFVGLSSGLSWLAWAAGTPVVMISGFTHPTNEFETPYRVFNTHVCNSCWHDIRHPFEHSNFLFCPRHKDTPRQFECTRHISSGHVIAAIEEAISHICIETDVTARTCRV